MTALEMTTEVTATEEATFTVTAEIIPIDRIRTGANVRSGKLPNIPSLAESIRRHGVLTAITVNRRDDGDFDLVAGFRRVAAARLAGLTAIPAVIRNRTDEAERVRRGLAENIDREGLRDLDQAAAVQQLLDLGVDAAAVAATVNSTPDNVRAWADLLRLPRKVRRLIERGRITAAEAHQRVSVLDDKEAMRVALERVDAGWDVASSTRRASTSSRPGRRPASSSGRRAGARPPARRDALPRSVHRVRGGNRVRLSHLTRGMLIGSAKTLRRRAGRR